MCNSMMPVSATTMMVASMPSATANEYRPSAENQRRRERVTERAQVRDLLLIRVIDVFGGVVLLLQQPGVTIVGVLIAFI